MYKLFDSCKIGNGWKRIGKDSASFHDYKSFKDNANIELQVHGVEPESYNFKKNAVINIKNSILKYHEKDIIQ